jgi:hypothetical protein
MRYFTSIIILSVFFVYMTITIFINFPEESVVVGENLNSYKFFQKSLYQKWTFFSPPPETNKRVFFEFIIENHDSSGTVHSIELFEKFGEKLKNKYLLNDLTASTDWILFNYTEAITNESKIAYNLYKNSHPCENDSCYEEFANLFNTHLQTSIQMNFLTNHARVLSKQMNIPINSEFRIKICEESIPRYHERYDKNVILKLKTVYVSNLLNLNTGKWREFKK